MQRRTSQKLSKFRRNLKRFWTKITSRISVEFEYRKFKKLARDDGRFPIRFSDRRLCIRDKTSTSGFDRHYVYHTAWGARMLAKIRPSKHIDISSLLYFSTLVSAFVPVEFYDYRPANLHLDKLASGAADLRKLPFADASVESLSCMHVVEHVGLGRYGDPIDPQGDLKAIAELKRVVRPGGWLLFVVPVGEARIRFNANRVYAFDQVKELFAGLELVEWALITDDAKPDGLVANADQQLFGGQYEGTGCFLFRRP
jgi:SAM-dependent methyltransferase